MKDEWEFDDDEEEEQNTTKVSASPVKDPATTKKQSHDSPANSSLSASSPSKTSIASTKSRDSSSADGSTRGRKPVAAAAVTSPAASTASSSTATSSSQQSSSVATTSSTTSSKGSFQPRTRTARMKAKGILKKSSNRKVRFELSGSASSDASSSVATMQSANHHQGYRSFAASPVLKHSRRSKQRKRMWNPDEEQEGDARKRKSEEKPKLPAIPVVRAASVDVYAIQDTVKVQRLSDELRYCCDTLRSSRKAPRQLEAVADLSLLLSNQKNRQCLLFSHHQQGNDGDEAPPLQILLQLMEWAHEKMGCSMLIAEPETGVGRTKSRRARAEQNSPLTPIVQEDCTMAGESSSSTSAAARKLRETLLSDRHAMQGLLEMVWVVCSRSLSREQLEPFVCAGLTRFYGKCRPDCGGPMAKTTTQIAGDNVCLGCYSGKWWANT
eukprot:scaffold2679_cov140-Amphora_coffeaeformis.AAC.8